MTVEKKTFKCSNCNIERYGDAETCNHCGVSGTILPIPQDTYVVTLNGVPYGGGSLVDVHQLISKYLLTKEMYGKEQSVFLIQKVDIVTQKKGNFR